MITKELVECLKTELSNGTTYDILRAQTIQAGWTPEDFNEAMTKLPLPLQEKALSVISVASLAGGPVPLVGPVTVSSVAASSKKKKIVIVLIIGALLLIAASFYMYIGR